MRTSTASLYSVSTIDKSAQQVVSLYSLAVSKPDDGKLDEAVRHVVELEKRVDELKIEKEALIKKISSIESSLGRWIFRACDYKDELRQMDYELYREEQEMAKGNSA